MAPSIGKLICNNRDAIHQRDEDTKTMMEMIMRKRNESISESETFREDSKNSNNRTNDQEEILEIAEAIRELAAKLQIRRERFNGLESNPQLNSSLNRSLELIKESIIPKPASLQTKNKASDQHNSLDAHSRLKSNEGDKWRSDMATPKAGNLSMLEEKTPLHSNVSRLSKDRLVSYNGMCSKPYPLTSNKPIRKVEATQPLCLIDDSLAILRNELTKAKTMEYHNDNHNVLMKKHPFSTKSQRSSSRSKTNANHDFEKSTSKLHNTNLNFDTTVKAFSKFRSLSAGRATQQGKHIMNLILGREAPEDDTDDKTLTATSSDSTHEPLPPTRRGKCTTFPDDAKLDIIVNHHYNSSRKVTDNAIDHRQSERKHLLRRSGTPIRTTEQSRKNQEQNRPTTPFRSVQTSRARQPMTIDASISNASMTSGYLAHRPINNRPLINSGSEKGFEIVALDGVNPKIKSNGSDNDSRAGSNIDRAAISQRLQHHQKSIMDKLRKDLSVTTDLRDDHDCASDQIVTSATVTKNTNTNADSTRATIMSNDKSMNDITTKSSHNSSITDNTNTAVVMKKRATATKQRRSIIRE